MSERTNFCVFVKFFHYLCLSQDKASGGVQMRDKTDRRAFATLRDQTAGDRATVPQASQSAYIPYYKRKQMELENKVG